MASVTSPDNIVFPDGGDTYTVPGVLGSMADTIQDALTEKANYGVGTSAEMNAALNRFPNGAVWFNTSDNVQYRRVSGVWVPNPGSNYGVGSSANMISSLGSFPDGALWYNTTDSTEYRKVAGAWTVLTPELTQITRTGTQVWSPSGGSTTNSARAVRIGDVATIYLDISNVTVTSGAQITEIGTIASPFRPPGFASWSGTTASTAVLGLTSSSGVTSIRWTSQSGTIGPYISASWVCNPL